MHHAMVTVSGVTANRQAQVSPPQAPPQAEKNPGFRLFSYNDFPYSFNIYIYKLYVIYKFALTCDSRTPHAPIQFLLL